MSRITTVVYFLIFGALVTAQEVKKDSINKMEELVITGQYSKQSVKKSIYEVKVISAEKIKINAANNIADLLNQSINIQIIPNSQTGKSKVSLFGLDGQYVKILLDGIPMVSDEGMGNNIDLTEINLDDIEKIEIVEGSMGVEYGANAVTGIINLITKKSTQSKKGNISFSFQEETIGNEYELWAKGRHIQSLNISNNLTKNLYSNITFSRNDFAGYFNNRMGKNYIQNDGLRGYEWLPKEQISTNANLYYNKNNVTAFYKFAMFQERLTYYDTIVKQNYNYDTHQLDKLAYDRDFKSLRFSHDFNLNTKFSNDILFDVSAAYQTHIRDSRDFVYDLHTRTSVKDPFTEFLNRSTLFAKTTLSNFIKNEKLNMQAGVEFMQDKGFAANETTQYSDNDMGSKMQNIDLFLTSEIKPNEKFNFRPGLRYSFQSFFKDQYSLSLSSKYKLSNNFEIKNIVGTSYRVPGYEELYTYFVDNTHNIQGNSNLLPENGFSVFTHFKWNAYQKNSSILNSEFTFGYLNLDNKIDLTLISKNPLEYLYINIDKQKSLHFALTNSFKYKQWDYKLGLNLEGISDRFDETSDLDNEFFYNFNANLSVFYNWDKYDVSFAYTHKYVGAEYKLQADIDDGEAVYAKIKTDAYQWADFSVKKYFFNKTLETTFGIRNLFDITRVDENGYSTGGTTHGYNNTGLLLGYGRSYFIKLGYNIQIK